MHLVRPDRNEGLRSEVLRFLSGCVRRPSGWRDARRHLCVLQAWDLPGRE